MSLSELSSTVLILSVSTARTTMLLVLLATLRTGTSWMGLFARTGQCLLPTRESVLPTVRSSFAQTHSAPTASRTSPIASTAIRLQAGTGMELHASSTQPSYRTKELSYLTVQLPSAMTPSA